MPLQEHLKIMYYHPKNTDIDIKYFSLFYLYVIARAPEDYVLPRQEHRHRHKVFLTVLSVCHCRSTWRSCITTPRTQTWTHTVSHCFICIPLQEYLKIMYYHSKNTGIDKKYFSFFYLYAIAGISEDYVLPPQEHRHRHKVFLTVLSVCHCRNTWRLCITTPRTQT